MSTREGRKTRHGADEGSRNITWHESRVCRADKERLLGQRGCVLWLTGLSGSGKSTVACELERTLCSLGKMAVILDGDNIRHGLNKDLRFSLQDRKENIRRIAEVARLFAENGTIAIVSFISPYQSDRQEARELMQPGDFIETYVNVPLEICEERDPKGLYKLARSGEIKGFTGVDDPYEEPVHPEIVLHGLDGEGRLNSPEAMAGMILHYLQSGGFLVAPN